MDDDTPRGWIKPERKRTLAELRTLIAEKRNELAELIREADDLASTERLKAIAQIRNIMRAHELTMDDVDTSYGRLPERAARRSTRDNGPG